MKKELDLMNLYKDEDGDFYDDRQILPRPESDTVLKKKNRSISFISVFFQIIFIGLIAYLLYFNFFVGTKFSNSTYNRRRVDLLTEKYIRGSIYSQDGELLAYTEVSDSGDKRIYNYGRTFAHVIGYNIHGGLGIEGAYHTKMLSCHANPIYRVNTLLKNQRLKGNNLYTTLNCDLQQICYDALGDNTGAVVVMDVKTGAIRAMVSKPDYDPNKIEENWDYYISGTEETESIFLNRATQGLYPPGSTFKILSALAYVKENDSYTDNYEYDCKGFIEYNNIKINCYNSYKHGNIDFKHSFAESCNSSFVNIGLNLNRKELIELCESFKFNEDLDLEIESSESVFLLDQDTDAYEMMQTVIGQGKTLVTPMHMVMIASTIANDGEMMRPYLLERVETFNGTTISKTFTHSYGKLMKASEVEIMQSLMDEVVVSGTATRLINDKFTVAGKTGSAEYGTKGDSHSWFVGYAPSENPEIAISVLIEGGGSGAELAVPITKKILNDYYY